MTVVGPAAGVVTLLGKTPARPDFIRIHHGAPTALAFDAWLQRNLEELVLAGKRTAPATRFLFAQEAGSEALVGALAPSKDKAGRAFPISLFTTVPVELATKCPHVLPIAYEGFFAQAATLFGDLAALDYESLKARVATITAPEPSAYEAAERAAADELAQAIPGAWADRLFAGCEDGVAASAVNAIATGMSGSKRTMFECPVQERLDAVVWLALASRGAGSPLSFFWSEASPSPDAADRSRLLLGRAPPPMHTLLHLAAPGEKPGLQQLLPVAGAPNQAPTASEAVRAEHEAFSQAPSLAAFLGIPG